MSMAGRMGGKRVTQVGLTVHEIDPSGTCCSSRARCPGRRTASSRSGRRRRVVAAPKAPLARLPRQDPKQVARGGRLRRRGQAAPRARDRARGAERRSRRHARRARAAASSPAAARSRGARRAPAVRAQARPARRTGRAAASPSRRRCATSPSKVNRKARTRRAAQRALGARPGWHARRARRFGLRRSPRRRRPLELLGLVGQGATAARRRAARGGGADQVVPQPRPRRRDRAVRARGAARRLGALAARQRRRARAACRGGAQ